MRKLVAAAAAGAITAILAGSAGATFPGRAGLIVGQGLPNVNQITEMVLVSAAGGAPRVIGYGTGPRWSPDGSRLAFGRIRGLEVGTTDGRRVTSHHLVVPWGRHVVDGTIFEWIEWQPSWSPRGRLLAYVIGDGRGFHSEIHVVRVADGKARRRLTYSPRDAFASDPAWSPNGRTIAYSECLHDQATCQIRLMRPDGSHKRRLVVPKGRLRALDPVWSPSGRLLAYDVCSDEHCTPWILDLHTGRRTRAPGLGLEAWSPGGTRIVYFDGRGHAGCPHTLVVSHVDGSRSRALPGCIDRVDWQPIP
jgi:dipeptidyl aminopeptidase/acylaminoacyl peptidase